MAREWIPLDAEVLSSASAVGKKEREGPFGTLFDLCDPDGRFGADTWESAESEMQRMAFQTALAKGELVIRVELMTSSLPMTCSTN